jgi:hypothetical protein
MSINIIPNTEDFSAGNWNPGSVVVTTNTSAPPAFAGTQATSADKLEDVSAVATSFIINTSVAIPVDSSSYIASLFIKKDSDTTRFPAFLLQFTDGSGQLTGVSFNTSTGAIANYFNVSPAPADKGVVDVDSLWWRIWFKIANDGTSSLVRVFIVPCQANTIGQNDDATLVGFITGWGVNLTNTSALQTYEPDPFYAFTGAPNPFFTTVGAKRMI